MKIVIVSPYKPPQFGLEIFYYNAFVSLGHEVKMLGFFDDSDANKILVERIYDKISKYKQSGNIPYMYSKKLSEQLKKENPDVIIFGRCEKMSSQFLSDVKSISKAIIVNIYPDHPFMIPGGKSAYYLKDTLSLYDCVFTFSPSLIPVFYQLGAKNVQWLPFGYCDKMGYRDITSHQTKDLAYFGVWGPFQEQILKNLAPLDLNIYGANWHKSKDKQMTKCWKKGEGMGVEMFNQIADTKITVNMVRAEHGSFHTMKTFEIPAAGGFTITNYSDEQVHFFKPDTEAVYFNTEEEMVDKVRFYQNNETLRNQIRVKAHDKVKIHTYKDRAAHLIEFFKSGNYNNNY